jgi:hypothetical protein
MFGVVPVIEYPTLTLYASAFLLFCLTCFLMKGVTYGTKRTARAE